MGIIIRQSLRASVVSYIGVAIGTFNILILYPKFLLPEQIGLIRLLQDFPILFASFFQLGAGNIAERFYFYFSSEGKSDSGLPFLVFSLPIVGFLLFLVGQYFFYDQLIAVYQNASPMFSKFFFLIIPLTFINMYTGVLEAYARVNFRIVIPALIREVFLRTSFSFIVFAFAIDLISNEQLIYLLVVAYSIALLVLLIYVNKLKSISYKPDFSKFSKGLVKEMSLFVTFLLPGMAGSMIASKIDTIMLGYMTNLTDTGVYSLAYFIGAVVETPKRALSQISIPVISRAWKENNISEINMIYKKSSLNLLIVGGAILLFIWVNINEIFLLMPNGDRYSGGVMIVLIIGLSRVIDMATGVNGEIIIYSKWFKVNLLFLFILAGFTILLNYMFIPIYGIEGAALSTLIAITIFNISKFLFLYLKVGIQPFQFSFVKVLVFIALLFYIVNALPVVDNSFLLILLSIIYKSLIILICFVGFLLIFNISDDINNILYHIWITIKNYFKNHINK